MAKMELSAASPHGLIPDHGRPADIACELNVVVEILCIVLILPVVALRIWVRRWIQGVMHLEDWVCISATILFVAYCSNAITLSHWGGGLHIWDVTAPQYERFLFGVWRNTVLYGPAALLIKITLLLIFTRIWAPFQRAVTCINIFIALLIIYYVTMFAIKIMVCGPIRGFWVLGLEAMCWDINTIFLADTIVSVTTDFAILIIPIPLIWDLRVSLGKKLKLFGILGAGGFAVGASAARLRKVLEMFGDPDKTVTVVEFYMLGSLELFLGLLCASFPTLNALVMKLFGTKTEVLEPKTRVSLRSDEEMQYDLDSLEDPKLIETVVMIEKVHMKEDCNPVSPARGRPPMHGEASCDYLLGGIPQNSSPVSPVRGRPPLYGEASCDYLLGGIPQKEREGF